MPYKNIPTPFFSLNETELDEELKNIKNAFSKYWNNYIIAYSVKTNSFPPLSCFFSKKRVYAEVVSEDEFNMVSKSGYLPSQIVANGPVKSKKWVETLLDKSVIINIDSKRELDYISAICRKNPKKVYSVGIRVNLDVESTFDFEKQTNIEGSRFGFCFENGELKTAIDKVKEIANLKIRGLHIHRSTKSRSVKVYRWLIKKFIEIKELYLLDDINYLDIGGGFYGGVPNKPNWEDYISAISEELKASFIDESELQLIIEPGVSLLAKSFSYYCSVVDIKKTLHTTFITLDGSRIHVDPQMHKQSYFYDIIKYNSMNREDEKHEKQTLVGFTCLEKDRFFTLTNQPLLNIGDIIKFDKVGAYTLTLAPLFISFYPAVYSFDKNGGNKCLRERWTANEFIQLSNLD